MPDGAGSTSRESPRWLNEGGCLDSACRRGRVKQMMQRAWGGYKNAAWGSNELDPMADGVVRSIVWLNVIVWL